MQETDRRGFWAILVVFILELFGAGKVDAATKISLNQLRSSVAGPGLVGYGAGKTGTEVTVGSGLSLLGGVLSTTAPLPPVSNRQYGIVLTRDVASGSYPVPAGARNKMVVTRNGMRQTVGNDYSGTGDSIVFVPELDSDISALVVIDGE